MPVTCGVCRSTIRGTFYKDPDVEAICAGCWKSLPKCTACQQPFPVGGTEDGRPYCKKCLASAPACAVCGDRVGGRHWKVQGFGAVCDPCWRTAAKCDVCGHPTRQPRGFIGPDNKGRQVCPTCWQAAARCGSCQTPISGRFYVNDLWPDRKFCNHCMTRLDQCDFCALPVSGQSHVYPDGRVSCATCRTTALTDPALLAPMDEDGRTWLADRLGFSLRPRDAVPMRLVGAADMAAVLQKSWRPTPGFDGRERGLFQAHVTTHLEGGRVTGRTEAFTIWIEDGLPRAEAFGTVVHELVHLWQFDKFPPSDRVSRQWFEGLACWAQYHALVDHGHTGEAEFVTRAKDPVYGAGFEMVRALEERHGFHQTVQHVLRAVGAFH